MADRPTILIVEDEQSLAGLFEAWLTSTYDCELAFDGMSALEAINADIEAILLDRRMPGMAGDEVLEKLRERGVSAPTGMITAVDPDFDIIGLPFECYLTKPIDRSEIQETVAQLLEIGELTDRERELCRARITKAALERSKTPLTLEEHEDYQGLCDRIETLEASLSEPPVIGNLEAIIA